MRGGGFEDEAWDGAMDLVGGAWREVEDGAMGGRRGGVVAGFGIDGGD